MAVKVQEGDANEVPHCCCISPDKNIFKKNLSVDKLMLISYSKVPLLLPLHFLP